MPKLTQKQAKKMRLLRAIEESKHRVATPYSLSVGSPSPELTRGRSLSGIPWVRLPKSRISLVDVGPIHARL